MPDGNPRERWVVTTDVPFDIDEDLVAWPGEVLKVRAMERNIIRMRLLGTGNDPWADGRLVPAPPRWYEKTIGELPAWLLSMHRWRKDRPNPRDPKYIALGGGALITDNRPRVCWNEEGRDAWRADMAAWQARRPA